MVSGGGFSEDELGVKWGVGSGVMEGTGIGVSDGVGAGVGGRTGFGVGAAVGASAGGDVGVGVGAGIGTGVGTGVEVGLGRTVRGGGGSDGAAIVGWGAVVGVAIRTWVFGVVAGAGAASSDLAGKQATSRAATNSGRMTPTARPDQRLRPFANLSNLPIVSY